MIQYPLKKINFALFFLCLLLSSLPQKSLSSDYSLLPKLESGQHFSQVYYSKFFKTYSPPFFFSLYFLTDTQKKSTYTSVFILPFQPYGVFSLSFLENNTQYSFQLPQQNFKLHFFESAFNLTYQKNIQLLNIQLGLNISDPVHFSAFQFNGKILPSMNLSFQFLPKPNMLFAFGLLNLFKKSSQLVHDHSETLFMSASSVLFHPFAFKLSLHRFKQQQIKAHFLLQYPLSNHWTFGFNISIYPFIIAPKISAHTQFGNLITLLGVKDRFFFASLSYSYSFPVHTHSTSLYHTSKQYSFQNTHQIQTLPFNIVNVNTADVQKLSSLPTIGPKIAQKIVLHRQQYGPFYSKIDLLQVKGIGLKKYLKFKNLISLGQLTPNQQWKYIRRWSMKHFVELGIPPSLSLELVLLIKSPQFSGQLNELASVPGFTPNHLKKIKQKLQQFSLEKK